MIINNNTKLFLKIMLFYLVYGYGSVLYADKSPAVSMEFDGNVDQSSISSSRNIANQDSASVNTVTDDFTLSDQSMIGLGQADEFENKNNVRLIFFRKIENNSDTTNGYKQSGLSDNINTQRHGFSSMKLKTGTSVDFLQKAMIEHLINISIMIDNQRLVTILEELTLLQFLKNQISMIFDVNHLLVTTKLKNNIKHNAI